MIPSSEFSTPSNTNVNTFWYLFTQFHSQSGDVDPDGYGVPIALGLHQKSGDRNTIFIQERGHLYDNRDFCLNPDSNPEHPYVKECGYLWHEQLQKDKWYDMWLHIKWSKTDGQGLIAGSVNGQSISEYTGPTLHPTKSGYQEMYLKQGLYRHDLINVEQSVYNDGTEIIICPSGYSFDIDTKKCIQ